MNWNEFIANVGDLVEKMPPKVFEVEDIIPLLKQLLKEPNLINHRLLMLPPGRQSADYLLHLSPGELWSMETFVWKKGAMTPIHDHLTWGVVGQYIGQELETKYQLSDGKLSVVGQTCFNPGEVTTLVPPNDIHQVRNVFPGTSVSIHVYGANMRRQLRHEYNYETGKITLDKRR